MYHQEKANTFSKVHITNNTDNIRVTTKQLRSPFSEFLIWNNNKTLRELPPNNSTHLFRVTKLTIAESYYQTKETFSELTSTDTVIFRELLSNNRLLSVTYIKQFRHFSRVKIKQ